MKNWSITNRKAHSLTLRDLQHIEVFSLVHQICDFFFFLSSRVQQSLWCFSQLPYFRTRSPNFNRTSCDYGWLIWVGLIRGDAKNLEASKALCDGHVRGSCPGWRCSKEFDLLLLLRLGPLPQKIPCGEKKTKKLTSLFSSSLVFIFFLQGVIRPLALELSLL